MINKNLILKITSLFENSTPDLQYSYIESLNDGRGYTFGFCGFTTGTGDGLEVVKLLPELSQFIPRLNQLAAEESGEISGLDGFVEVWRRIGTTQEGISAQQQIGDKLYWNPALSHCATRNWVLPLSIACIYDAIIQHGEGNDPDGLGAMLAKVPINLEEKEAIKKFLFIRRDVLANATDPDTREVWKWSVTRVEALYNIAQMENWNLLPPIIVQSRDFNYILN